VIKCFFIAILFDFEIKGYNKMKFYQLLNFFAETYSQSKERPAHLQNNFYVENRALMNSYQSSAQDAVQKYAPMNLTPNMDQFRKGISIWQEKILKKKKILTDIDVYNSHVFSSLDVKNNGLTPSHHCSGFLLYQSGILVHQIIDKAGINQCFSSKLISAAAHTFNNIENKNALELRQATFGAIAIGGMLLLFCPLKLFKNFSKSIAKISMNINKNQLINQFQIIEGGNKLPSVVKLLGKSLISTSSVLFADEYISKQRFNKALTSEELFNEIYENNLLHLANDDDRKQEEQDKIIHLVLSTTL
jgi:hypothetical protein